MPINHFLIVYNLRDEELVRFEPFGTDVTLATLAYAQAESEYHNRADNGEYEIVLVGADSRETLEITHSRYFKKGEAIPF
ncbi:MAG TPA: hypothetical protein VFL61_09655 [Gaiellaceae bacterium]|nr:hypothetical protein [Gaiellaceae bacterium]